MASSCEYCGARGCHWTNHDDAVTDVKVWQSIERARDNT